MFCIGLGGDRVGWMLDWGGGVGGWIGRIELG